MVPVPALVFVARSVAEVPVPELGVNLLEGEAVQVTVPIGTLERVSVEFTVQIVLTLLIAVETEN